MCEGYLIMNVAHVCGSDGDDGIFYHSNSTYSSMFCRLRACLRTDMFENWHLVDKIW